MRHRLLSKQVFLHAVFFTLLGLAAWQSHTDLGSGIDGRSLLYAAVLDQKVVEGPLDPSEYAATGGPGIGGMRLAAIETNATSLDLITLDGPDVAEIDQLLQGQAALGSPQTLVAQPGSEGEGQSRGQVITHTTQEGDTRAGIAAQFNISENTLTWANPGVNWNALKVGESIKVLPITGVEHEVEDGDTILAIAKKYDANALEIVKYNRLPNSHELKIGQELTIPDGAITAPARPRTVPLSSIALNQEQGTTTPPTASSGLVRPVSGYISQQFGRWGHSGTDFAGNAGQGVKAAAGGVVAFSGWRSGYGNAVIVDHGGGLQTLYAHHSANKVQTGEAVAQGEVVGIVGSTGRSTGPHSHFEVLVGGARKNPCSYVAC